MTPPDPTRRLHRDEPLRLTFEGRVVAYAAWQGRPSVVLAETAFYPESGAEGRLPLGTDFEALMAARWSSTP